MSQEKDLASPGNPHHGTYNTLPKLAQGIAGLNCVFAVLTFYLDFRASSKANSIKDSLTKGVTSAIRTAAMRVQQEGGRVLATSLTSTETELLDSVLLSSMSGETDAAQAAELGEATKKAGSEEASAWRGFGEVQRGSLNDLC